MFKWYGLGTGGSLRMSTWKRRHVKLVLYNVTGDPAEEVHAGMPRLNRPQIGHTLDAAVLQGRAKLSQPIVSLILKRDSPPISFFQLQTLSCCQVI